MSAWIFALVCLSHSASCPSRNPSGSAPLSLYLAANPAQPAAPVEYMKRELTLLLQVTHYQPVWNDAKHPDRIGNASALAVIELDGVCDLPPGSDPIEPAVASGASLGQTVISAQGVMPFSRVNCANLTRLIGPTLSSEAPAQRQYLYGRAMARVVAHELYHVLMGSRDHGRSGIAKAEFAVADLLDEVFRFNPAEVAQLQQKAFQTDANLRGIPAIDSADGR